MRSYHAVRSETGRSAGAAAPAGMSQKKKKQKLKMKKESIRPEKKVLEVSASQHFRCPAS